jgi:nucleoside-diphosphate-sugar epimerase
MASLPSKTRMGNLWNLFFPFIDIHGVNLLKVDLKDFQELKRIFSQIKPDAVIHTAAQSSPNYCQNNPDETHLINVTASANIAGLCADYSIPCVFTSTDLVFNGLNPPYQRNRSGVSCQPIRRTKSHGRVRNVRTLSDDRSLPYAFNVWECDTHSYQLYSAIYPNFEGGKRATFIYR